MTEPLLSSLRWVLAVSILGFTCSVSPAEETTLDKLSTDVLDKDQRTRATGAVERDIQRRTRKANVENLASWSKLRTREDWERYRDPRVQKLRESLLHEIPARGKLNFRVTHTVEGDGFRIEDLAYESRPGVWVSGNLYSPSRPTKSMPGMLLVPSHHTSKTQSELQDMGMTWARAGCVVLVSDPFGYGERRLHPFHRDGDYAKPYRIGRQDYYHRYDSGVQLQLLGDSLMGWFYWDLSRGVDLLLSRDGIDPKRIIILGSVAGGGDPAGVTAALDERIACCVPFNFGGPQPETRYPLPHDAETTFDYLGGAAYWDSTRGLRGSGRDDFGHWLITSSVAPRNLIHGHEFAWDGERDPVWKRYQKIWGDFYASGDNLGVAHGKGTLKQSSPEASHCNHIGQFHRRMIHPLFEKWFSIRAAEFSAPRKSEELMAFREEFHNEVKPKSGLESMTVLADQRIEQARKKLQALPPAERRQQLRQEWGRLLGKVEPGPVKILSATTDPKPAGESSVERVVLEVEPDVLVPLIILKPTTGANGAAVVCIAQSGKSGFFRSRRDEIQKLLQGGWAVVLPDLRGTGETQAGSGRGRDSGDTNRSVHLQLFGETVLGQRLRDLRSVLGYLRQREARDIRRVALWGDSFSEPNPEEMNFRVPHAVEGRPQEAEPMGDLVCLLGLLFEDDLVAGYSSGGLERFRDVLTHFAVLVPHDACVPGMLTVGDIGDLAGWVGPVRREGRVDHLNRVREKRNSVADWLLKMVR